MTRQPEIWLAAAAASSTTRSTPAGPTCSASAGAARTRCAGVAGALGVFPRPASSLLGYDVRGGSGRYGLVGDLQADGVVMPRRRACIPPLR